MTGLTAAERRKAISQLKGEMDEALLQECDRRRRKNLQKEYDARLAALSCEDDENSAAPGESLEPEGENEMRFILKDSGPKKAELKRQRQAAKRQQAMEEAKAGMAVTDQSETEAQRLSIYLVKDKLRIHPIAADGNCLYKALAHQLSIQESAGLGFRELRHRAADFIERHREDYVFLLEEPCQSEEGFKDYLLRLRESDDYGGEVELMAIAKTLQRPIKVYIAEGPMTYGDEKDERSLKISFHRHLLSSCHYNSLVPMQ